MFIDIGANKIKAKGTHFFIINSTPTYTSIIPTNGRTYPVAPNDFINSFAFSGNEGGGIKPDSTKIMTSLLAPNTMRINPNTKRIILVKLEFIREIFELVSS